MRLNAVTVCVDYSDFLAASLPHNRHLFDRMVVVTEPWDHATQQVCDQWDVEVLKTDVIRAQWGEFHKAKGINAGLGFLAGEEGHQGWVLHLDADIVLPPRARVLLERAELDKASLYGADRLRVPSWEAWQDHLALPNVQTDGYHVRFRGFDVIPRFNAWHIHGYAPVGYFQLWHPYSSEVRWYPADHHDGGDRTDVLFAQKWDRQDRQLLPEFAVYHLESEPHSQGTNWNGRQTARFGPAASREPYDYSHRVYPHHKHHDHHSSLLDALVPDWRRRHHRHHHHHHHHPGPYPEPPHPDAKPLSLVPDSSD